MSLGSGRYWILPTRKREQEMTGHRIRIGRADIKDGKVTPKSKPIAGKPREVLEARAKKEADRWTAKSKR